MSNSFQDPSKNSSVWVEAVDAERNKNVRIMYTNAKMIGNGVFGVVYHAKLSGKRDIAIKKVLQDKRYVNRELEILRSLKHSNIVSLFYYFYTISSSSKTDGTYLSLVQEYLPENLGRLIRTYWKNRKPIPLALVKIFSFQLLRALAYMHNYSICHRDIKPQNILIDPKRGILKLCDFGSAKKLNSKEPNVSYICSRHYRAPELIFGATYYTTSIDIWSAGCVVGELLLGRVLFPGDSGIDQLVEIMKVLGTPDEFQMQEMNPSYSKYKFPKIKGCTWERFIRHRKNEACFDLLKGLLVYAPCVRLTAAEALSLTFFTDLLDFPKGCPLDATGHLPNGESAPHLLANFTEEEMNYLPNELVDRIKAYVEYTRNRQKEDNNPTNPSSNVEKPSGNNNNSFFCIHEQVDSDKTNAESKLPILKSHVCHEAVSEMTKRRSVFYHMEKEGNQDSHDTVTLRKTKYANRAKIASISSEEKNHPILGNRPVSMSASYHSSILQRRRDTDYSKGTNDFDSSDQCCDSEQSQGSEMLCIVGSSTASFRRPRRNTLLAPARNLHTRKAMDSPKSLHNDNPGQSFTPGKLEDINDKRIQSPS